MLDLSEGARIRHPCFPDIFGMVEKGIRVGDIDDALMRVENSGIDTMHPLLAYEIGKTASGLIEMIELAPKSSLLPSAAVQALLPESNSAIA